MSEWSLARDDAAPSVATDHLLSPSTSHNIHLHHVAAGQDLLHQIILLVMSRLDSVFFQLLHYCGRRPFFPQTTLKHLKVGHKCCFAVENLPTIQSFHSFWPQFYTAYLIACRDASGCNDICSLLQHSPSPSLCFFVTSPLPSPPGRVWCHGVTPANLVPPLAATSRHASHMISNFLSAQ